MYIIILLYAYKCDNIYNNFSYIFGMHYRKNDGSFLMQLMKLQVDDEINIDESRKHLRSIHKDSKGDITIASKSPIYNQ